MLNRSNIEEANKHLQALYSRVSELESVAEEQHRALIAKDSFIQTKIKELSQQDLLIANLKHKLEEKDSDLTQKDEQISSLKEEVKAQNLQIGFLKQKSKALSDLMSLLPDLKSYISKVDAVVLKINELDRGDGYVKVNGSPSLSDDADNADGGNVKSSTKSSEEVFENTIERTTSGTEMAKNFAELDGIKNISLTEADIEEGSLKSGKNQSTMKELYF